MFEDGWANDEMMTSGVIPFNQLKSNVPISIENIDDDIESEPFEEVKEP